MQLEPYDANPPGTDVHVVTLSENRSRAVVRVELRGGCPAAWRLGVALRMQERGWKIDRVATETGRLGRRQGCAPRALPETGRIG